MKRGLMMNLLFIPVVLLSLTVYGALATEPVKVGIIGPMGFFAGDHEWRGAVVAADEINAAGGVSGRSIQLIKVHSNELVNVPDAASAMEKMITVDKVAVAIGGYRSEAVIAMQDVACDYKTVFFGCLAHFKPYEKIATDYNRYKYFFNPYPNAFYMGESIDAITATIADVVRKELRIKTPKVAIIAEKTIFAEPLIKKLREKASEIGVEIVGEWRPSALATDVNAELTAVKGSGAQQICSVLSGPVGITVGKQWYDLKIPVAMAGVNNTMLDSSSYLRATKAEYSAAWDPGGQARIEMTPKTIPFWDKYYKKWGDGPSFLSAYSYDCLYLWKEAVERAGTFDSNAVVEKLEKTDFTGVLCRVVFEPREHRLPHSGKFGKGYITYTAVQLIGGEVKNFWPVPDWPKEWGIQYKGTVPYQLPPWMKEYWKGK